MPPRPRGDRQLPLERQYFSDASARRDQLNKESVALEQKSLDELRDIFELQVDVFARTKEKLGLLADAIAQADNRNNLDDYDLDFEPSEVVQETEKKSYADAITGNNEKIDKMRFSWQRLKKDFPR